MLDHTVEVEPHHLTHVLALQAFAAQVRSDPVAAKAAVSQVFGLVGDLNDELLLCAMQLLAAGQLADAKPLLVQIAQTAPEKIPAVYAVVASVFKYFNAGLSIRELAAYGIDWALQVYQAHPQRLDAQQALLDLLLYFGSANDVARILGQTGVEHLQEEAAELQLYLHRLQHYQDTCKLSIVLITYQRPEMLRHTLACLHSALTQTNVEIVLGVNDNWPETRQVIESSGVDKVFYNICNTRINLYKQLFLQAGGEYIIEIDDDISVLPKGFDQQIIQCLEARADLGLVGHWPTGFVDVASAKSLDAAPSTHQHCSVAGLPFGMGPVAGVCAGMRRKDFLTINGFSRATLSKYSGEEPQLIRKLALHGKLSGVIFNQGLEVFTN